VGKKGVTTALESPFKRPRRGEMGGGGLAVATRREKEGDRAPTGGRRLVGTTRARRPWAGGVAAVGAADTSGQGRKGG
jgi:hypothetical protein